MTEAVSPMWKGIPDGHIYHDKTVKSTSWISLSSSETVRSISIFWYFRPVLFNSIPTGHMWLLSTGHEAGMNWDVCKYKLCIISQKHLKSKQCKSFHLYWKILIICWNQNIFWCFGLSNVFLKITYFFSFVKMAVRKF